jgi:hypothetical protein
LLNREVHTGTTTSAKLARRRRTKKQQTQELSPYQTQTLYLAPEGLWFKSDEVLQSRIENIATFHETFLPMCKVTKTLLSLLNLKCRKVAHVQYLLSFRYWYIFTPSPTIQWFSSNCFIMTTSHPFPFVAGFLLFLLAVLLDEFLVELCKIYLIIWPLILISHHFPTSNQDGLRDAAFTLLWWGVLVLYWIGSRRLIWWGLLHWRGRSLLVRGYCGWCWWLFVLIFGGCWEDVKYKLVYESNACLFCLML